MITTTTACDAHYALLLDGEAVICNRPAGHEGQHEARSMFGDVRAWDDGPECWAPTAWRPEGAPRKLVLALDIDGELAPTWGDVRIVLDLNMPMYALEVAPLTGMTGVVAVRSTRGLTGSLVVTGPRS